MAKENTRKLAEEFGIPIFNKPDSQDICFVPGGDYAAIVRKVRPNAVQDGEIVHIEDSRVVGKHNGIINFTIGQRRGLNIGGTPEPLYVIKLDAAKNRVYVGPDSALDSTSFQIRDVNWLTNKQANDMDVTVKIRSAHQPVPAIVKSNDNGAEVKLLQPQKSVTPGQACVMYDGERVLGGGWIVRD